VREWVGKGKGQAREGETGQGDWESGKEARGNGDEGEMGSEWVGWRGMKGEGVWEESEGKVGEGGIPPSRHLLLHYW